MQVASAVVLPLAGAALAIWSSKKALQNQEPLDDKTNQGYYGVASAYGYLLGGLLITLGVPWCMHVAGRSVSLEIGSAAGLFGFLVFIGLLWMPYHKTGLKHMLWSAFMILEGVLLTPLLEIPDIQHVWLPAIQITTTVFLLLTFVAVILPRGSFAKHQRALAAAFGFVALFGLLSVISPVGSFRFWDQLELWSGLLVCIVAVAVDTDRLYIRASQPGFDPIHQSLALYLDWLNIFVRVLLILAERNHASKKKNEKDSDKRT
jgi:FtsH-binding integral membrane protein